MRALERVVLEPRQREAAHIIGKGLLLLGEGEMHVRLFPLIPAQAGTQSRLFGAFDLGPRFRGDERQSYLSSRD